MRTCEGLGVRKVYFAGCTPHPEKGLPHEQEKLRRQIHKTALGAEEMVECEYVPDLAAFLRYKKAEGVSVCSLEQAENSVNLKDFCAEGEGEYMLILGEEVHGVPPEILALSDVILEIPMAGRKESFNVSVAAGIAVWELTKD